MQKRYFLEDDKLEWFKNNYSTLGGTQCAKELNLPIKFLHKTASKLKLRVSKKALAKNQSERTKNYHKKEWDIKTGKSKKIKITTAEEAYTLGFLWGDGYLNHPKNSNIYYPYVGIVKSDFDDIINTFKCLGEWHSYYRKRENRKEQGEGYLCDSIVGWFLKENDYSRKSSCAPYKILSLIPENLQHYWWRGYVDADGCFYSNPKNYVSQFSIAGSYNQDWGATEHLFKTLNISNYKICQRTHENYKNSKNAKDSIIRITNKKDILKIGYYVFKGKNEIGLKRKYKKFLLIANN